jgi:hypothetical protein
MSRQHLIRDILSAFSNPKCTVGMTKAVRKKLIANDPALKQFTLTRLKAQLHADSGCRAAARPLPPTTAKGAAALAQTKHARKGAAQARQQRRVAAVGKGGVVVGGKGTGKSGTLGKTAPKSRNLSGPGRPTPKGAAAPEGNNGRGRANGPQNIIVEGGLGLGKGGLGLGKTSPKSGGRTTTPKRTPRTGGKSKPKSNPDRPVYGHASPHSARLGLARQA